MTMSKAKVLANELADACRAEYSTTRGILRPHCQDDGLIEETTPPGMQCHLLFNSRPFPDDPYDELREPWLDYIRSELPDDYEILAVGGSRDQHGRFAGKSNTITVLIAVPEDRESESLIELAGVLGGASSAMRKPV